MQETYYEEQTIKDKKFQNVIQTHCKFIDCQFENCSFEECTIVSCGFINCKFTNCKIISLTAQHSEVKQAAFQSCSLIGIHCWKELQPAGTWAHSIDSLKDCSIKYNSFVEMPFRSFDFSGNSIQKSMFEECNLQKSSFRDCRLEETQISKCDLREADFRGARGYLIDIPSNRLKQAKFSFPEVVSLLDSLEIRID